MININIITTVIAIGSVSNFLIFFFVCLSPEKEKENKNQLLFPERTDFIISWEKTGS